MTSAHQPVDGAAASGDRVQNMRAFGAFLKRPFDGINLPLDAANPIQELVLIANDVCQRNRLLQGCASCALPSRMIIYPGTYLCLRQLRIAKWITFSELASAISLDVSPR